VAGAILFALLLLAGMPARAQDDATPATTVETPETAEPAVVPLAAAVQPERIEIGLSTDSIAITSDFSGAELTIFGAVDNVDPLIQRQGRYDIFVTLEGPTTDLVTRRKGRVLGIWMNVDSQAYLDVPESFLIASTRPSQDIASSETLERLSLGVKNIRLRPYVLGTETVGDIDTFTEELRRLKAQKNLYEEFPSGVHFISQSLFRATLQLPANVPLGRHTARAYLFRQGTLVAQTQSTLDIRKAGLEFRIYTAAQTQSLLYGLAAVALAFVVGWLGRVLFKKD
jgi:uncharacterized protein (TIGR02186 family)